MVITITFLVFNQTSVVAQECTTKFSLGEDLVRELWNDFKMQNVSTPQDEITPGFQSIHEDRAHNTEAELKLLEELNRPPLPRPSFRWP